MSTVQEARADLIALAEDLKGAAGRMNLRATECRPLMDKAAGLLLAFATHPEGNAPTIGEGVREALSDAILVADTSNPAWRGLLLEAILAAVAQPRSPYSGIAREVVAAIIDPRRWEMHEWAKANSATPFNVKDLLAKADAILAALSEHQGTADADWVLVPRDEEHLAMLLCDADGHEPHELTYHFVEPGVQEPYGDRWNHYVPQARRLLAASPAPPPQGDRVADLEAEAAPTPEKNAGEALSPAVWQAVLSCGDVKDRLPCQSCGAKRLSECRLSLPAPTVRAAVKFLNGYGWKAAQALAVLSSRTQSSEGESA